MFCNNCGKNMPDNAAFCNECGTPLNKAPQQPVYPQQQPVYQQQQPVYPQQMSNAQQAPQGKTPKDKASKYRIAGIILLILGVIAYFGMFAGSGFEIDSSSATGIATFIGFNSPIIAGVILLVLSFKNKNKQ